MATNTGFKGVDVRQTGGELVVRSLLQTSAGALVTTGTTTLKLYEVQSDGTIKTYDFSTNTFVTTTVTTLTASMTYQKANNGAADTGLWTYSLGTLTGFTIGAIYLIHVNNSGASPTDQIREIQWGGDQGDLAVVSTGTGAADLICAPDWGRIQAATTTVNLSGTTVGTLTTYTGNTPQTGDSYARIGATGSGLTSLAPAATALSTATWTAARAGYLDNLNVGGAVASHADATSLSTQVGTPMQAGSTVTIDTTALIPTTGNATNSIADCLNAARAQGFGKWAISGTTLNLYAGDGTTVIHSFTLDSATAPTSRT